MERLFDIFFSTLALMLLSPLLIPIVFILRLTGEGEIFFLQNRVGRGGKTFKLYKFATMLKDSPNIGTGTITVKNDPRVLPIGKFLRKTKINELPQLLNILFGSMSIIGPRPLTSQTFNSYQYSVQKEIKKVRPGLSGIGSIIFRDEESIMDGQPDPVNFYKNVIAKYKGELEEWHVANKSLYIYFLLIILTIYVVIFPSSKIVWKVFDNLPKPPEELYKSIKYID
jgi:lipopolysaccharide/colanic/teichoic acid biosynthesis glycosyltransferase